MAAQIMVQQLDANWDPVEGPNGPVFLTDLDAVAQILATRLKLLLGEWWEDLSVGFPLFQSLIGSSGSISNQAAVLLIIQQYILVNPFVTRIASFTFANNSGTRASIFMATVETQFGTLTVTNAPGISAVVNS